jgi:hypothetical protein
MVIIINVLNNNNQNYLNNFIQNNLLPSNHLIVFYQVLTNNHQINFLIKKNLSIKVIEL